MSLEIYQRKRNFRNTPEPKGKLSKANRRRFVVQEHHASKLHFDFRLEMDGVLKSWSLPKGPTLDPSERRLAVATEDHPVEYLKFEGHIPEGNYGAGEHMIWDEGTYELVGDADADPLAQLDAGKLAFRLKGDKLAGEFNLIRLGRGEGQWLLLKRRDEFAQGGWRLELRLKTDAGAAEFEQRTRATKKPTSAAPKEVKRYSTKTSTRSSSSARGAKASKPVAASSAFKARELEGDVDVKVGGEIVPLTHLDKLYWPEDGYTKGDLLRYYFETAKLILPYLKDRPLIMKRYPNGIAGTYFHQHDVNEAPDFVRTATLDVEEGHTVDYIIGDDAATLLYMANLGAIERHPWHSRVANLEHPDWLVFDLDPGEGITYETICELALSTRDALERVGLECYPKTSGSRGMHVYVPVEPVYTYEQVAAFAEDLATLVAHEHAEVATVERALKKRRRGQIYLDHMQNARGKSVVAPYSVRPRPGATVSAPLEWREVERKKITPQDFHIRNMRARVERKGDLFKPVLGGRQKLEAAVEKLQALRPSSKRRRARA